MSSFRGFEGRNMVMYMLVMVSSFLLIPNIAESRAISHDPTEKFIKTSGTHFVKDQRPFYFNGFNAYWLMMIASDPSSKARVSSALQQSAKFGMTVARTWAFSDAGNSPLQSSPGIYNEDVFKALDFVVAEAGKSGIYLIMSFVNNYKDFGGRPQYVQWAKDRGQQLASDDDFYTNPIVKGYYKNHVKTILLRKNSITGVLYKDDPTIFAWELMNEPRCESDLSGRTVQDWISEMAAYVKSIDKFHLLEIGLEGFYGEPKKQSNPNSYIFGTDFISNNQIQEIDFATIHAYPEQWLPGSDNKAQLQFTQKWLQDHIQDSNAVLQKPLVFGEFGKSSKVSGFSIKERDLYYATVYNDIYASARSGGPCAGALFWQMLEQGLSRLDDGYQVVFAESPSTAKIIAQQSFKLSQLNLNVSLVH